MSVDELYQEVLLDHFKHPRCQAPLQTEAARMLVHNPLCGDRVDVALSLSKGVVSGVTFSGSGCCISQAATSMLSELVSGKNIEEARALLAKYRDLLAGRIQPEDAPELGEVCALSGVRKFTARLKCALIGSEAIEGCIQRGTGSAQS